MTSNETADALIAWTQEVLDLPEPPRSDAEGAWPLPDVACAIVQTVTQRIGEGRARQLQQGSMRVRTCRIYLFVQPMSDDSDSRMLYDFTDLLMDGLVTDDTLGRRVARTRREASATFEPPLVTLGDDTEARLATVELVVEDPSP